MNWLYNGKEITDISQFPLGTFGFIYEVSTSEGKKYIGKKALYHNKKTKLKKSELAEQSGRGRRALHKIVSKESDWKKYYGSNKHLKNQIAEGEVTLESLGKQIIEIGFNKKHLTYLETKYLFQFRSVGESQKYIITIQF
jgi:hypothetical protein